MLFSALQALSRLCFRQRVRARPAVFPARLVRLLHSFSFVEQDSGNELRSSRGPPTAGLAGSAAAGAAQRAMAQQAVLMAGTAGAGRRRRRPLLRPGLPGPALALSASPILTITALPLALVPHPARRQPAQGAPADAGRRSALGGAGLPQLPALGAAGRCCAQRVAALCTAGMHGGTCDGLGTARCFPVALHRSHHPFPALLPVTSSSCRLSLRVAARQLLEAASSPRARGRGERS